MALCISGDFPDGGKEAERLIKSILGAVTTPALARQGSKAKPPPPPQLPPPRLPLHTTPRIACYVDREASTSNLTLTWKRAKQGEVRPLSLSPASSISVATKRTTHVDCVSLQYVLISFSPLRSFIFSPPQRTAGDYRRQVLEQIFAECFNTRLYKVSRARAPPFYTVGCEAGDLGCCEVRAGGGGEMEEQISRDSLIRRDRDAYGRCLDCKVKLLLVFIPALLYFPSA